MPFFFDAARLIARLRAPPGASMRGAVIRNGADKQPEECAWMNGKPGVSAPPHRQSAPSAAYHADRARIFLPGKPSRPNRSPDYSAIREMLVLLPPRLITSARQQPLRPAPAANRAR